jgi:hypothetical protein
MHFIQANSGFGKAIYEILFLKSFENISKNRQNIIIKKYILYTQLQQFLTHSQTYFIFLSPHLI